MKQLTEKNY